ncbi:Macro domain-containing protein, partial [Durusdinium trenchii]
MLPYFARLFLLVLVALEVAEATEGLKDFFEHIVHAAPPMYTSTDWEHKLSRCWKAALEKAWSLGLGTSLKVASPLLGAGACGAPVEEAAQVAARAFVKWAATPVGGVLSLGTREEAIAATVEAEVVRALTLKSLSE